MKVRIDELRTALVRLLDHVEGMQGQTALVEEDYY